MRPAFFFEGALRLTEGETLSCAKRGSYDRIRKGRFFNIQKLKELGEIYLHRVHTPYFVNGKDREVAYEISVGKDVQKASKKFIYVTRPLKYKGYEFYRNKEGYAPLFVLRDVRGRVLYGAYVSLQSIRQEDGTYIYRSGTAAAPGSFPFPKDPKYPHIPTLFWLKTTYHPDMDKKRAGEVLLQGWRFDPSPWVEQEEEEELFKGKVVLGENIRAGDYLLSMDEVRYWASMKVIYRPGLMIIYSSFWIGLGGLILSAYQKMARERKQNINSLPLEGGG